MKSRFPIIPLGKHGANGIRVLKGVSQAQSQQRWSGGILPCGHVCQPIPQLPMYGTESHRRRTQEKGKPKADATFRREVHAAQGSF